MKVFLIKLMLKDKNKNLLNRKIKNHMKKQVKVIF